MIPREYWCWSGYPGHFAGSSRCRFWLHTRVGLYRISTVGHYVPKRHIENVGDGRTFETKVYALFDDGTPEGRVAAVDFLDFRKYSDSREAEAGHLKACEEYAARQDLVGDPWDAQALAMVAAKRPSPRAHGQLWDKHEPKEGD